jgi:hypothetical protein
MGKDLTPASGKRLPDGPAPDGYKKTLPDKESPNVGETFDSDKEIFPLKEMDYLPNADGIS